MLELGIMVEPPEGGAGKEQKLRPLRASFLQMGDRLGATGRIVTRVRARVLPGNVPSLPARAIQPLFVTVADNHDRRARGEACCYPLPDAGDQLLVVGRLTPSSCLGK